MTAVAPLHALPGRSASGAIAGRSRSLDDADMIVTRLDPAEATAMEQWYDLVVAVARHDRPDLPVPGRTEHFARFDHPWPGSPEEALLARDGERVVGAASYLLSATLLRLELVVHPQHRRQGIGTRLLEEVYAAARRHRRDLIEVQAVRGEAGYRYLTHRAHRPLLTSIRSRCPITARPVEVESPDGYSLVQWRDRVPEDIIQDVAALQSRLMDDAPTGGLTVEQQRYDAERVRAQENTEQGRGHHWYSTAARHDATGHVVARTKLAFESDDHTFGRQRITIVEPAHRGHRLGLVVKAANHAFARSHEPALTAVDAWNAEDNVHMRAVNTALGFQPVDAWSDFQIRVPTSRSWPAGDVSSVVV